MISFDQPFTQAEEKLDDKVLLRTELNAGEMLAHTSPELRECSFFSSRVISARLLQEFKDGAQAIIKGESNYAQQRLRLKQLLAKFRYTPEAGKEGTLQDLSSNARLNLVLRMNVQMVRGYSRWQQRNRPGELIAFPALELIRVSPRIQKRAWIKRWNEARAALGDATTATEAAGSEANDENGIRAFALKNDPIWPAISRFGLPYEPFDFNSGMGTRAVPRREAQAMGMIKSGEMPPQPKPVRLRDAFAASMDGIDDDLVKALQDDLSDDVEIEDGVLRFSNEVVRLRGLEVLALTNALDLDQPRVETFRDRGHAVLRYLQEAA